MSSTTCLEIAPIVRGVATAGRTRAQIVADNDKAIRDALCSVVLEVGWDAVTFTGVAKRAGLTVGAVYGRAENPAELGIDLWESTLGPWFAQGVADLFDAAAADDPESVVARMKEWGSADAAALSVELLIASLFDEDLAEVVRADALGVLARYCLPSTSAPRVTVNHAAAGALLMSFAFGRAIAHRAGVDLPPLSLRDGQVLAGHRHAAALRVRLPKSKELHWVRPLDELDPHTRSVIRGTVDVVGRVGYRRATIARIGRAAEVPRGGVLSHYKDKAGLVAEAARLALVPPGEVWSQYADVVAEHGPLLSRAIFLADFLKPANARLWAVNLELARMSRFVPELNEFCPGGSVLEQTHLGVMLTASLVSGIDTLPYAGPFTAGSTT